MGYRISADRSLMERAVSAVESYESTLKSKMNEADGQILALRGAWQGEDSAAFLQKWRTISGSGSSYQKMQQALEDYAAFLRMAKECYQSAQEAAVNRANTLAVW